MFVMIEDRVGFGNRIGLCLSVLVLESTSRGPGRVCRALRYKNQPEGCSKVGALWEP